MEAKFNKIDDRARSAYVNFGALCLRGVFSDRVEVLRSGKTSPPFPGHNMRDGQKLRTDWFPVLWRKENSE